VDLDAAADAGFVLADLLAEPADFFADCDVAVDLDAFLVEPPFSSFISSP